MFLFCFHGLQLVGVGGVGRRIFDTLVHIFREGQFLFFGGRDFTVPSKNKPTELSMISLEPIDTTDTIADS